MSNDRLTTLLAEYADLEKQMEDPSIHSDQALVRRVGRRFAELAPLNAAYHELEAARADLAAARELAAEDPSFATEVEAVAAVLKPLEEKLGEMLIPRDPHDAKDVRVDVYRSSGPGGQSVNTTDSAVRVVYKGGTPDEVVVTCKDGKWQSKNRE